MSCGNNAMLLTLQKMRHGWRRRASIVRIRQRIFLLRDGNLRLFGDDRTGGTFELADLLLEVLVKLVVCNAKLLGLELVLVDVDENGLDVFEKLVDPGKMED